MRMLFGIAAVALLAPAAVQARDYEVRQIRVNASALDLSAPAGMDELARRIHRAVNRICGSDRDCKDEAWASTEEQVAWAIDRDLWMRQMAEERMAQLDECRGCDMPEPAYYPAPPMPAGEGRVTVVIVHNAAPPAVYRY